MLDYFSFIRPLLFSFNEETAHHLAIASLRAGWIPHEPKLDNSLLKQQIWGLRFSNPIGLAAGFDKHAEAIENLEQLGFGFIECGTVTPQPQQGNPRPRLFRLKEDRAIINRFGFNSKGADYFEEHFLNSTRRGVVGINIGKNKISPDAAEDYIILLRRFYSLASYITINISSPNTPNLRDLQQEEALERLLSVLMQQKQELLEKTAIDTPLLLKISPDITLLQQEHIAEQAMRFGLNGLIISNTTLSREWLKNQKMAQEQGGLSGEPLKQRSTDLVRSMYRLTQGSIPIIGVGGISTAEDAYRKIKAGASLVQLYTALIYHGFRQVTRIKLGLIKQLEKDGFTSISQAIGVEAK